MNEFIDIVSSSKRFDVNSVSGYSSYEIECIKRLYDIEVKGQFLSFLQQIGRCAGNAVCDHQLIFFSDRSVRQQVLLQRDFRQACFRCRFKDYVQNFFLIGTISYKVSVILKTASDEPDNIFFFHEQSCELEQTGQTLLEYVDYCTQAEYRDWSVHQSNPISFRGELISFD